MTRDPENDPTSVSDRKGGEPESVDLPEAVEPEESARAVPDVIEPATSKAEAAASTPSDEAAERVDPGGGDGGEAELGVALPPMSAAPPPPAATSEMPGGKRLAALVASVAVALSLSVAAHFGGREAGVASVSDGGTDGGTEDAAVASTVPSAVVLPSPKDPVPAPKAPTVWRVSSLKDDASVTYVEGPIGKKTLSGALAHAGMPTREVHRLLKAFEGKKKLDRARPKDTFAFAVDKEKKRLVAFELCTSPEDVWQAKEENETLAVKKLSLAVERRRVAVGFTVTEELHEAVTRSGLDDDALKRLDDALDGHFELSDLRPGTRLRLVITELRVEGALARYAHVDAVEVRPPSGNSTVRVYHFDEEADADAKDNPKEKKRHHREHPTGFFDAKGHQPYHGGWRSPVPGARISSRFNPTRLHPVLHVVMPHNGIDFAAPTGAKVYASSAGSVVMAGNGGPCGNMVQIEHPGGLVTAYCHLSKFAAGLHAGQHVDTRQLIGYVGATGRVTGPHLHFALKKDQKFVDPMTLKMDGVRVLPARDREAFGAARALLDGALDAVPLPSSVGTTDAGTKDEEVFDDGDDESDAGKADTGAP